MYININEKLNSSYINTSPYLLAPRICGGCKCPNDKCFLLVRTSFDVRLEVKWIYMLVRYCQKCIKFQSDTILFSLLPLHTDWLQQLFRGLKAQSWLFWHCHSRIGDQLNDILLDTNKIISLNLFSLYIFYFDKWFDKRLILPSYHIPPYSSMRWLALVTPNRSKTLPNLKRILIVNRLNQHHK